MIATFCRRNGWKEAVLPNGHRHVVESQDILGTTFFIWRCIPASSPPTDTVSTAPSMPITLIGCLVTRKTRDQWLVSDKINNTIPPPSATRISGHQIPAGLEDRYSSWHCGQVLEIFQSSSVGRVGLGDGCKCSGGQVVSALRSQFCLCTPLCRWNPSALLEVFWGVHFKGLPNLTVLPDCPPQKGAFSSAPPPNLEEFFPPAVPALSIRRRCQSVQLIALGWVAKPCCWWNRGCSAYSQCCGWCCCFRKPVESPQLAAFWPWDGCESRCTTRLR